MQVIRLTFRMVRPSGETWMDSFRLPSPPARASAPGLIEATSNAGCP